MYMYLPRMLSVTSRKCTEEVSEAVSSSTVQGVLYIFLYFPTATVQALEFGHLRRNTALASPPRPSCAIALRSSGCSHCGYDHHHHHHLSVADGAGSWRMIPPRATSAGAPT